MAGVVAAARRPPGVIHFDIARELTDSNSLIATEIFEDRAAMDPSGEAPEVAGVIELMSAGALTGIPVDDLDVADSESPSM